jgi:transketolase
LPEKFLECGIAEQDMVSVAGGLARMGLLPIVNSFASFLASRANEQIYNNATEKTKIVYACHYAGLIPAGPGKSHQSLRDIALLSSLPNMVIVHPGGQADTRAMVDFALGDTTDNVAIRLAIGPSPREIVPPDGHVFRQGQGYALTEGSDVLVLGYGPVLLHEALIAVDILSSRDIGMKLVNMPWMNRFDADWFTELLKGYDTVCVLDDHMTTGGLGDLLLSFLVESGLLEHRRYEKIGVDRYPVFGTPPEALAAHLLDGSGIANRIAEILR